MENLSALTPEKENGQFAVKSSPRSGRDAATQTPQMLRHLVPTKRQADRNSSPDSSLSDESLVCEDSIPYPPSVRNMEMPHCLPIPAVTVEHSNDTFPLTQSAFNSSSLEQSSGIANLAFEGKDETVRSSSASSYGQQPCAHHANDTLMLQHNQHLIVPNNPSDPHVPWTANVSHRMYYSLPKTAKRKHLAKELEIRSQPPTPQMHHSKAAAVSMKDSNFWIIPHEHTSNSLNTIPAVASKHGTTDSAAGLYTISGRSTIISNGLPEPVIGLYEMHLIPQLGMPNRSTPRSVRKYEFTKMPASVDRKRRRLQRCTDILSLLLLIPGIFTAIFTPVLIIPLFYVGTKLFISYGLIVLASGTLSVVLLCFSGFVGNVVWYYDEKSEKLRPRLHCGKGPLFHFWGSGFYSPGVEQKQKELVM